MNNKDPTIGNISACLEMANHIFKNNWSVEELYQKIKNYLASLSNPNSSLSFGKPKRPSWDDYFMEIKDAVSKRATCDLNCFGCVIARDNQILVTGYSGAPVGLAHCDEIGHLKETIVDSNGNEVRICSRIIHAEQNAICQAAKIGTKLEESTIYLEKIPCGVCAKSIVSAGIRRIVVRNISSMRSHIKELFLNAGVRVDFIEE
jgi:dCMP deaminase